MQPDLLALAARVEALDGPDRGVDAEVARALGYLVSGYRGHTTRRWHVTYRKTSVENCRGLPEWTASVDAVLDLIGRELPGYGHAYTLGPGHRIASARVIRPPIDEDAPVVDPRAWATHEVGGGASPALALLSVFLRAKAAQQQEADRG